MLTRIYKEDKDALKEYLRSRTQDLSTDVLDYSVKYYSRCKRK